nr:thiamine phosphate synthase [Companilactobacillus sp.]
MKMKFDPDMLKAYFVCGSQDLIGQDFEKLLEQCIESGITAFQYRDKGSSKLTDAQRLDLGRSLQEICKATHVPFIVDDDVRMANALNADGVHVGQKDERITKVVQEAAPGMIIGLSCQTVEQVHQANKIDRIDYIGAGPIFPTSSKNDAVAPMGLPLMKEMSQVSRVPFVAIGGIDDENVYDLKPNGAVGAAFISLVTKSNDVDRTIKNVLNAFA